MSGFSRPVGRRSTTGGLVMGLIAAVAMLSACAGGSVSPRPSVTASPTAEQEAQWVLPMDRYSIGKKGYEVVTLARNILSDDCWVDQGLVPPWKPIRYTEAQISEVGYSPAGLQLFNEKLAASYGYTVPQLWPPEVVTAMRAANTVKLTDSQVATLRACDKKAANQLGSENLDSENNDFSYAVLGDVWKSAKTQASVTAAAAVWHTCMAPLGIADLPALPDDSDNPVPTPSMKILWGGTSTDAVSPVEITQAVADAKCRTSSGYTHQFYLAMWNLEEAKLAADPSLADRGQRARNDYDTMLKKARTVIAANAGL